LASNSLDAEIICAFVVVIAFGGYVSIHTSVDWITGILGTEILIITSDVLVNTSSVRVTEINCAFVVIVASAGDIGMLTSPYLIASIFGASILIITRYCLVKTTNSSMAGIFCTRVAVIANNSYVFTKASGRVARVGGAQVIIVAIYCHI
jgi:hypothetical protein